MLSAEAVRLGLSATDKEDALRQCGAVLVEIGAAGPAYVDAMLEREQSVSTYMGEGVAIPHGTDASSEHINRAALAFLQFPDGVDWNGKECQRLHRDRQQERRARRHPAVAGDGAERPRRRRSACARPPSVDEVLELLAPRDDETTTDPPPHEKRLHR